MNTKSTINKSLIFFVLSIVLIITTNTYVSAKFGGLKADAVQTEPTGVEPNNAVEVVPGGPGFIMVSPFDFIPVDHDQEYSHVNELGAFIGLYNPGTKDSRLAAGLTLPHGASITKLTLYFVDNSPNDMWMDLKKTSADGSFSTLASLYSYGQSSEVLISTDKVNLVVVDNQINSYHLIIGFQGNVSTSLRFVNARIDYAFTTNLPTVMN